MRKDLVEYCAKEEITATENRDWARLREAKLYTSKCYFNAEEKEYFLKVQKETPKKQVQSR